MYCVEICCNISCISLYYINYCMDGIKNSLADVTYSNLCFPFIVHGVLLRRDEKNVNLNKYCSVTYETL
jgi:hypothetical protein